MTATIVPAALKPLYPFNCKRFEINGIAMNYVDEGPVDTRPVLMLHGNPSWSFYYRHLIKELSSERRVIVPDHIGCGLSDKPQNYSYCLRTNIDNIKALLDHLHIAEADLIVHDWGGAIGMGLATEEAFELGRLVILNTAAFIMPRVPLRIQICKIPGFGALAIRGFNAFAIGAALMGVETRLKPEVKASLLYPYNSWNNRIATLRFVQDIPMAPGHPTWALANQIHQNLGRLKNKPIQIHWGVHDFCFTMDVLAMWQDIYPAAEVFLYDDAGHYCLEDAHQKIAPEVKIFLCQNK